MKEKLSVFECPSDALFDIWENASDKIIVLDKHKRIVFINNRFQRYYGINQVDAVGKHKKEVLALDSWKFSIVSEVLKYKKHVILLVIYIMGLK